MLNIGVIQQTVKWHEAGMTLDLVPLPEDVDTKFIEETTTRILDDNGRLKDLKRDLDKYAEKVGLYCIKGWSGAVDGEGENAGEVPCNEENIKRFMKIGPAREYIFSKVKSLKIYLVSEAEEAKKG